MAMDVAKHHQHHQQHNPHSKKGNCTLKREELLGQDLQKGQSEIIDWIRSALGEPLSIDEDAPSLSSSGESGSSISNSNRLYFLLRDGTVLCKLFVKLFPGTILPSILNERLKIEDCRLKIKEDWR